MIISEVAKMRGYVFFIYEVQKYKVVVFGAVNGPGDGPHVGE